MISTQLFEGPNLRLTYVDPEQDAKVETGWTYDLDYVQGLTEMPARPLGALALQKMHEENQKHADDRGNQYYFAIRLKEGDRLAGFVSFPYIAWVHASAWLRLGIADPAILVRYGAEVLAIALRYGFRELNLYRVETVVPEYQRDLIGLLEDAGYLMEVRRRQVFYRGGRYYDALHFGLLQTEWKANLVAEVMA
jgi:RimJ/RimL family protein N-acetyltransferase